ncbi:MAG: response regulator [Lachnospiraceae bacterium]|nr:response regulator [Lachnospiraceae bacterium]
MILLIADDEELTRNGLRTAVDWESLQIHKVLCAEDGIQGLELAREHHPDIILTDVRMPRMDGIHMVEEIRQFLPDTGVIFMSGYSDKEYLKAAIKFKAINYVEKPLNLLEIEEAVSEAVQNIYSKHPAPVLEPVFAPDNAMRLASMLTRPLPGGGSIAPALYGDITPAIGEGSYITTMIIKFMTPISESVSLHVPELIQFLDTYIKRFQLADLFTIKHDLHLICHLYGDTRPSYETIVRIEKKLQSFLGTRQNYFIACGKTVHGIHHAYESYCAAVVLIQSSFFYDYNSILSQNEEPDPVPDIDNPTTAFSDILQQKDSALTQQFLDRLYDSFKNISRYLPNQVKDIYYRLFQLLQNTAKQMQLKLMLSDTGTETILDYIGSTNTLLELHQLLTEKTALFFQSMEEYVPENTTIYAIKSYIGENYDKESLSVKDISEHVYLSTSYVCTLFKNETGQTLNQYLTEFRMERAKQLLSDPRYKISDISSKVGYADGNYFGKSFKKAVGLSPSEFREKMLP